MHGPECLILGAARGYGLAQLRPFLVSLRATGYRGRLCLLMSTDADPATVTALERARVIVEPFDLPTRPAVEVNTARYLKYLEVLLAHPCEQVFLTDTRDVIFQADPFALDLTTSTCFFMEPDTVTLGTCATNSHWLRAAFGKAMAARIGDRPISCSGTTLGTRRGILDYLKAMIGAMAEADPAALTVTGIDQAIHNMLIQDGRLSDFSLSANGRHVLTMGHLPRESVTLRPDGIVANADGTMPAVVHQYNYPRHEDICRAVLDKYR
ncbi:MAG: hypothetical protein H7841_07230 [Magnetospirillum sp. WYHS-4]